MNLNIDKFIFETPLYDIIRWEVKKDNKTINNNDDDDDDDDDDDEYHNFSKELVGGILCYNQKVDGPCIYCQKETTYSRIDEIVPSWEIANTNNSPWTMRMGFRCTRNNSHEIEIIIKIFPRESAFLKIGQFPSIADLNKGEINKYRKILGSRFNEFSKGIGLISHGVGIGAFVYLRRVFENLIEDAHKKAKTSNEWIDDNYPKRMDQKIEFLKDFLPQFLVKNKIMYGILSKGIHELEEQECLDIFPAVKLGIELILDEEIKRKEEEEKIKHAEQLIKKVATQIKKT